MRTQSQRDHVSVHRPLAVGAVAFMLVMVLTGASLAHLATYPTRNDLPAPRSNREAGG